MQIYFKYKFGGQWLFILLDIITHIIISEQNVDG
jgi:hypothetical protein